MNKKLENSRKQVSENIDPSGEINAGTELDENAVISLPNNNFKMNDNTLKTKK